MNLNSLAQSLPQLITCPYCAVTLKLNEEERLSGLITCPQCRHSITMKLQESILVQEKGNCPDCDTLLKLSAIERVFGAEIVCPVCSKKFKSEELIQKVSSTSIVKQVSGLQSKDIFDIPEPTKSLLWMTNEDPSLAEPTMGLNVTITITENGARLEEKEKGIFAEPSLIWRKVAIAPNDDLQTKAMYWPSYIRFEPEERYQYLKWLGDITQPTNLSYVFLYFYGLERHLLIGDYDSAVDEIIRLMKAHKKQSFISYATTSLIVASMARKRLDVLERAPFLLKEEVNEALAMRIMFGSPITAEDITSVASKVGFTYRRYLKLYPELFEKCLANELSEFEKANGSLLTIFDPKSFKLASKGVFANLSIPEQYRVVKVPQILENSKFKAVLRKLLEQAHEQVKIAKSK